MEIHSGHLVLIKLGYVVLAPFKCQNEDREPLKLSRNTVTQICFTCSLVLLNGIAQLQYDWTVSVDPLRKEIVITVR